MDIVVVAWIVGVLLGGVIGWYMPVAIDAVRHYVMHRKEGGR